MKRQFKNFALVAIMFLGFSMVSTAQVKLGHINSRQVVSIMPEMKGVQLEMEKSSKTYEDELKSLYTDFGTKQKKYSAEAGSKSEAINQSRSKELQQMQERIQGYQQAGQQGLERRQGELMEPILTRIQKAIDEVAKEKGLDYIFDASQGQILFAKESLDILPLLKVKLGIK